MFAPTLEGISEIWKGGRKRRVYSLFSRRGTPNMSVKKRIAVLVLVTFLG